MVMPLLIALGALALAVLAEALHARRTARVAKLAFGSGSRPAWWAPAAPIVRCLGLALAVWGAVVLVRYDPVETDVPPSPRASRQLLICLDVSPSMQVKDAGPDAEKISRARWAGKLVQAILDRLDMKETRITVVAFYTKAIPVLQDTTDKNVVANIMDGLPMHVAFDAGATDVNAGLETALRLAKPWARRSATLVVVTDGDLDKPPLPTTLPSSIADTIVIGVGDPAKATPVSGHSSRQDAWTLKQLAGRLNGYYHEGNRFHLPTKVLDKLTMLSPRGSDKVSLRDAGLAALGAGSAMLALIGPLLMTFGLRRGYSRQRRDVSRRRSERDAVAGSRAKPGSVMAAPSPTTAAPPVPFAAPSAPSTR